jgi:hypothetical protein
MSEKDEAETGQPTDLGGLSRLIRSGNSEELTAGLDAGNRLDGATDAPVVAAPEVGEDRATPA